MKNLKRTMIFLMLMIMSNSYAQSNKWVMPPYVVDVTSNVLTTNLLPGHTSSSSAEFADGVFDSSGNLLFYIENERIYNHLGVNIGITANTWYSEYDNYQIIPVPGDCQKFYVVSAEEKKVIGGHGNVFYSLVDISSGTAIIDPLFNHISLGHAVTEYVQMATSKLDSNNERFLYIFNSGIAKFKITNTGISFVNEILNGVSGLSTATPEKGELEISPDNSKLAFYDWSNFGKINVVTLNSSGNYLSHNIYSISNLKATGFEFLNNELYVSTFNNSSSLDGINVIDLTASPTSSTHIPGSAAYGRSEIELAKNGNMIVRSNTHLAQINTSIKVLTQSIAMPNVNISGSPNIYDLPDQLDDEINFVTCCGAIDIVLNDRMECFGTDPTPFIDIFNQLGGFPLNQLTIKWYYNGVLSGTTSPVQFLMSPGGSTPQAGTYSVEVYYPHCGTPSTASMTYTLTNCPTPNCEIEPIMKINFEDCVFSFENHSNIGGGTTVIGYLWNFGDGTSSTDENPYHVYKLGGNYTVTFTVYGKDHDGNCCSETITEPNHVDRDCEKTECTIKVGMKFQVLGNTVILSDHSFGIGYTNIVGYKWEIDGILISTLSNFAIQLPAGGHNVCLTVYAFNNLGECCEVQICEYIEIEMCEEVDEITIIKKKSQLNYSDKTPSYQLNIHPNPTNGKVDIDFNTDMKNGSAKIIITDLTGNIILEQNINSHRVQINMNSWESGLYFCKIIDGNQILTEKIIKN